MSSLGLSRRLLGITGRMSIHPAEVATDPDFIAALEHDYIDHWRPGRDQLLTGEDRSTWFWLLRRGGRMLYLPDVRTVRSSIRRRKRLLPASRQLMLRWFDNMLAAAARRSRSGPARSACSPGGA